MKARTAAVTILNKLDNNFYGYEEEVEKFLNRNKFSPEDKNFINLLVKGTIEQARYLDFVIEATYRGDFKRLEKSALNILRIGVLQAKILHTPVHAYVNETVNITKALKKFRLTGLINGVLRHLVSDAEIDKLLADYNPVKRLGIIYSFPDWMIKKWTRDFGEENTLELMKFYNSSRKIFFRLNTLKTNADTFFPILKNKGFEPKIIQQEPGIFFTLKNPGEFLGSNIFHKGLCSVQDLSQAFAAELLTPQEKDHILDLCAAPGGKSTYLAQLTKNLATIKSYDISHKKLNLLRDEIKRQDIRNIEPIEADAAVYQLPLANKILVDAPCTGTGIIGRKADLRWSRKANDFHKTNMLQRNILANAAKALQKGGVLVYSTCSIEKEENQAIVAEFLDNHPDFVLEPAQKFIDENYCDEAGFVNILPFKHQLSGSFAARLKKV